MLTFSEQRNAVENMRQGSSEEAANFLIRVSSMIWSLGKDWPTHITAMELDSLQYEVSINRVKEEFRHVLDSEVAKYGRLNTEQMYNAVKRHEGYLARNKRLKDKSPYPEGSVSNPQQGTTRNSTYKPCFKKTTVFVAAPVPLDENEGSPVESDFESAEEEGTSSNVVKLRRSLHSRFPVPFRN